MASYEDASVDGVDHRMDIQIDDCFDDDGR